MSQSPPASAKGSKRARTRALLIEAASQVIAEKGYERTSLEEVARRCNMTRGAIYGNFRNREELFLAVVETKWQPIVPPLVAGASFRTQMRALAEAIVAAMPSRREAAIGAASFNLYALTHADMREKIHAANAAIYQQMAARIRSVFDEADMSMPAETFVRVAHAMADGLMFLHALTPDLIDDKVVFAAFEALGEAKAKSAHAEAQRVPSR